MLWVLFQIMLFISFFLVSGGEDFADSSLINIFAFICATISVPLGVRAVFDLRNSLSVAPMPIEEGELVSFGVYKFIRHPMYTAVWLGFLAIALWSGNWARMIVWLFIVAFFILKSRHEEELLKEKYDGYAEYIKSTGAFFPRISQL